MDSLYRIGDYYCVTEPRRMTQIREKRSENVPWLQSSLTRNPPRKAVILERRAILSLVFASTPETCRGVRDGVV